MKIRQKILNLILILAMTCSALVFTGVESFATDAVPTASTVSTAPVAPASFATSSVPAAPITQGDKSKQDVKTPSILQKNAYALEHTQKTGIKYALFKFLMAMLGVLVSALAIFAGLKFYKKIVLKSDSKYGDIDYDKMLESPKDFKEAINLFLHKTKR